MYQNHFLVGSDPEIFALDSDNNCIPPFIVREEYGLPSIGGDVDEKGYCKHPEYIKDHDILVTNLNGKTFFMPRFLVMEDGALFEFTLPPTYNPEEMYENFLAAVDATEKAIGQFGLHVGRVPSAKFDSSVFGKWEGTPELNFACRFGCDVDINVYDGLVCKEVDATKVKIRTAGCHVHTSTMDFNIHDYGKPYAQFMDMTVGQLFVATTNYPEQEAQRQMYYGKPGKVRYPIYKGDIYGLEYRTPSITLFSSLDKVQAVYRMIDYNITMMMNPKVAKDIITHYNERAVSNILTFNQADALKLLHELSLY